MKKAVLKSMMLVGLFAGVACGGEMDGENPEASGDEAVASVEQSASTTSRSPTVMKVASSCDVPTQLTCAGLVRHCVPGCTIDRNSSVCKSCIEHTFTFGIDCWSCLYNRPSSGGGSVPTPEYYSCRSFASGGPDDTSHPRFRSATSKIQETCNAPVYDRRTRRWTKWCCLFRVR
ncbi:MAG: hypothetical protein HYY84_16530 [Deltaproteobacteria bacterium]|nr:hypothetical protein [Deltaproteobacteria bacterium]